ncbi:adenosine deaminase-like protein [Nematostella vectensis]|uniref:adenosine deaminase-like protein n=1 Tax=Nematostella vectensis TaxID=45351 RepID=UPI0020776C4D|nr:adenosine deaminase-like protein [Nematostella vectensis]
MADDGMMAEFCRRIPKIELHAHLNGSISLDTMDKLFTYKHQTSPDDPSLPSRDLLMGWKADGENFSEGFKVFSVIHKLVDDVNSVKIVTGDVIHDFAGENVKYLELRSTPKSNPKTGMTKQAYVDAILTAIEEAKQKSPGIVVRYLVSIDRKKGPAEAVENAQLAVDYRKRYGDVVCGVDLGGDPAAFESKDFLPALAKAKKYGLKLALHIAEVPGAKEAKDLLELPTDRIGHGTCLHPDRGGSQELLDIVEKHAIPLELCLSSNVQCHTVSSYDDHHMWHWYNTNHPFVICVSTTSTTPLSYV